MASLPAKCDQSAHPCREGLTPVGGIRLLWRPPISFSRRGLFVQRFQQAVLIVSTLLASWLGMQAVHELGHVLGAWATGGQVERVVLHPLTISRTDLAVNPQPLVVVWAGPVFGVTMPFLAWAVAAKARWPGVFLLRFFAGFCLIANGAYLSFGSLAGAGDAGDLLRHGSPMWLLWLFGLFTVPAGLFLWHRQGQHFGFGTGGNAQRIAAYAALIVLLALVALGLFIGGQ